ncbi:hypothetical protein FRC07_014262 [Ceratobasidium sp. 392]|nr:hypothetical protein FRC07_014262 [Ceratobasidium sp. 392]
MSLVKGSFVLLGSMVPSANNLSGSSYNNRCQDPHKIGYPKGWRAGETEKWYKSQPTTKFTHLQYRKEREAPFYHEYIVLELDNNTVCRFDRRGDVTTRAGAFTFEGITAEDTAHVIQKYEEHYANITDKSDMQLRIHFPNGQDLLTVLAICYGIQKDDITRAYSLTRYNCYFLSWTIIIIVARGAGSQRSLTKYRSTWEELVRTVLESLNTQEATLGSRLRASAHEALGLAHGHDTKYSSELGLPISVGTSYFISTIRKAIFDVREIVHQSLGQLLFESSIESSTRQIVQEAVQKAAAEAARNYAGHAAREAAKKAVVDSMWRTIITSQDGSQLWERQCKASREAAWNAASAATDVSKGDGRWSEPEDHRDRWETAWDAAWLESWNIMPKGRKCNEPDGERISTRAKETWANAWFEACAAYKKLVPRVGEGVVDDIIKSLLDSWCVVLNIDMGSKSQALVTTSAPGSNNSMLQKYIRGRISELCQRARNVGAIQHPAEIEEAMQRVWVRAVEVLDAGKALT